MRVPLTWLAELVPLPESTAVLAERLTMAGLAVEGVETHGDVDPGVRVGRIEGVAPHPDADRLRVCDVALGDGTPRVTIVSGAPGLRRGLLVAVATPGARLADGRTVTGATLRGVESGGVLCSAAELGLGVEADRLLDLPARTRVGEPLGAVAGVRDVVLEVDVTPNRGDCLSILGIAREVAATTGTRLRRRTIRLREDGAADAGVAVALEDVEGCPRYVARVVRGVRAGRSPLWLRLRLERAGMRSIDTVVDAANHVMLETGQPLHTFDRDRVEGGRVVVRRARPGESIETLDAVERRLDPADLVIADAAGPVAIAGVMGGARTAVGPETTALLLESAYFDPASVRRSARRLGLSSEASYRFERRVDPDMVPPAIDALAALVTRLSGGRVVGPRAVAEEADRLPRREPIVLRPRRAMAVLGLDLPITEIRRRLRAAGADVQGGPAGLAVTPPSHRADIAIEADLVEEIARLGGYDAIPVELPVAATRSGRDGEGRIAAHRIRRLLAAQGLAEAVTPTFVSDDLDAAACGWIGRGRTPVRLANPLSAEYSTLRRSPIAGLVRAARLNVDRGADFVGLFEVGKGFGGAERGQGAERMAVAVLLLGAWPPRGVERQGPEVEFADVKGVVENLLAGLGVDPGDVAWDATELPPLWHPGRAAVVSVAGRQIGALGTIHPGAAQALDISEKTLLAEVDFQSASHYRPARSLRPLPRFPAVTRDIAVVVDEEFRSHAVLEEIGRLNHPLIESARLFDCYRGDPIAPGKKSLAYTIAYRAPDRTLTDDEVGAAHETVRSRLRERFAVDLRS